MSFLSGNHSERSPRFPDIRATHAAPLVCRPAASSTFSSFSSSRACICETLEQYGSILARHHEHSPHSLVRGAAAATLACCAHLTWPHRLGAVMLPKTPGARHSRLRCLPHACPRARTDSHARAHTSLGARHAVLRHSPCPLSAPLPTFRSASQRGQHTRDLLSTLPFPCAMFFRPRHQRTVAGSYVSPPPTAAIRAAKELMPCWNHESTSLVLLDPASSRLTWRQAASVAWLGCHADRASEKLPGLGNEQARPAVTS